MLVLDGYIVNVALPSIRSSLGFSEAGLQWVVSAYALSFGGFLLLAGRASDLYGRRRLFVWGLVVFSLASLFCGLAPSSGTLVGARAAQGLGAAMVAPAALSLLTTSFAKGPKRDRALSVWSAFAAAGATSSLVLGGLLTSLAGWRWVFLVNVPVGILAAALAFVAVRADDPADGPRRLDAAGAATGTAGLALLVFSLAGLPEAGLSPARTIAPLAASLALLGAFVLVEGRAEEPLVRFSLFRSRPLSWANVLAVAFTGALAAQGLASTLYLQGVLGYSALGAGLAFLPMNLAATATSVLSGGLLKRLAPGGTVAAGMALLGAGLLLHARFSPDGSYAWEILPAFVVFGLGVGPCFVGATVAATSGVAASEQGLASGVFTTAQQVGPALGLAVFVSVAAAVTAGLGGGADPSAAASVAGYRWAYLGAAALCLVGALAAPLAMTRRR